MRTLTQGDIQVESAITITDIQEFHMKIRGNAHTYIWLEGIIPDKEGEKNFFSQWQGQGLPLGGIIGYFFQPWYWM